MTDVRSNGSKTSSGRVISTDINRIDVNKTTEMTNGLLEELEQLIANHGVKKSAFKVTNSEIEVYGWKFNEWEFKKKKLPINARGLFTMHNPRTDNYEIVIRGYDKFFNIGETPFTNVSLYSSFFNFL